MVLSMDRWRGKVAVVTGASAGIGAAISQKLVHEGLQVVGLDRRHETVKELSKKLIKEGARGKLYVYKADVTQEEELLRAFKWIKENLGTIHILINNAGVIQITNLIEGNTEKWRKVFDTNVLVSRMKLVLFLFLLSVLHESLQEHFNAFLCDFCNCTNKEDLTVVCKDGDVSIQHIFDDNSWFDVERKPYPYRHLTIHRIEMMTLDSPFPQSNLVSLEISEGAISSIANGVFINLQSMRELSLSRNRLIAISPEVFRGNTSEGEYLPLKSLRVLKLDHNQIFEIEPHLFKHITNLEVLDLSVNPLTIITLEAQQAFAELSNLRELYLSTTRIKTLPDHFLHTHANLQVLDLSGNPISAIPQDLKYAENLHTLYLNDTQLITLDNKTGFPKVPNLKVLYMCHITHLVNISAGAFSGLESLEELYLNDNVNLRQIDDYAFAEKQEEGGAIYPPIKKFYIQNNKLESVARELIASWDRLVGLDLGGNKWSCDCTNQWIIDNLLPTYATIEGIEKSKELKCGSPIEMDGIYMHALREKHYQLRCLDVYGARPENDGTILIGLLAGILITIPLVLFLMYAYQRNWFGLFSSSPAAYSRQFYNRTTDDNMF